MGKVYLVGAGPGDPGLLTVAAVNALKRADVVLYDRLVDRRVLELLPRKALRVYVGAGVGDAQRRQQRIYSLMRKHYKEGRRVVRLKNGDPFIFGRGGEEMEFLRRNHMEFELVPGVTSAIGVPSWVGVPLTTRDVSSGLMILSGHRAAGSATDWSSAGRFGGTIVVLMGVKSAGSVCRELIRAGKDPATPACMISRGTRRGQKVVAGRLDEIQGLVSRMKIRNPAVAVVGDVVRLAGFWKG